MDRGAECQEVRRLLAGMGLPSLKSVRRNRDEAIYRLTIEPAFYSACCVVVEAKAQRASLALLGGPLPQLPAQLIAQLQELPRTPLLPARWWGATGRLQHPELRAEFMATMRACDPLTLASTTDMGLDGFRIYGEYRQDRAYNAFTAWSPDWQGYPRHHLFTQGILDAVAHALHDEVSQQVLGSYCGELGLDRVVATESNSLRRQERRGSARITRIRYEREPGLGPSPGFSLEIEASGAVTYTGRMFVRREGRHRWQLAPAGFQQIAEALETGGFFGLGNAYTDNEVTCMGSGSITAWFDDGTRKDVSYYDGDETLPKVIRVFEATIERLSGAKSYVHE